MGASTNSINTVFYSGVTLDLLKRIFEHKNHLVEGFTTKYHVSTLVYYEQFEDIVVAIEREKQIKAGSRLKKLKLIRSYNPSFVDLYSEIAAV